MKMTKFLALALASALAVGLAGCGMMEQGNVGVRTQFGKIDKDVVSSGFYTNVVSDVTTYTGKETTIELDNLAPQARDKMTVEKFSATVFYQAEPTALPAFQGRFAGQSGKVPGDDFYRPGFIMLKGMANSAVSKEVGKYDAALLNTNRTALETGIKTELQSLVDGKAPGVFTVTGVVIREIVNDQSVQQSIRDNVNAANRLDTATKMVLVRDQEALANAKLAKSYTPEFLQHEYNDALKACADSDKCTLIVDGSSSGKVLNLGNRQ